MAKKFFHSYLSNGIEVLLYPIKEINSVSIYVGLPVGSSNEKENQNGTLHFLEHMMIEGNKKYPEVGLLELAAEEIGLSFNGLTGNTENYYIFSCPDNKTSQTLDFIFHMLTEPVFEDKAIEKTRDVILTEQKNHWDIPENTFYKMARTKLFGDHPYNRRGFGEIGVVEKIQKENIIKCFNDFYYPENFSVSIAGKIDGKKTLESLEKVFGKWRTPKNKRIDYPKFKNSSKKPNLLIFNQPRNQVNFSLDFLTKGHKELSLKEQITTSLFRYLLGGGRTSVLNDILRNKLGLVYSIWTDWHAYPFLGKFEIGGTCNLENLSTVINEVLKIIRRVKKEGFKKDEFKRAVEFISARTLVNFSGAEKIASNFFFLMIAEEELLLPEDNIKIAKTIKLNEVNRVADKIMDLKNLNLSLMGDEKGIKDQGIEKIFNDAVGNNLEV